MHGDQIDLRLVGGTVEGGETVLKLKKSTKAEDIIGSNYKVFVRSGNSLRRVENSTLGGPSPLGCVYEGHIENDLKSSVQLSTCNKVVSL